MATTRIGYTTANADNAATAIINYPAGMQNGDVLLLFVSSDGSGQATAPAGWNTVYSAPDGSNSNTESLFWREVNALSGSLTVSVAGGPGERAYLAMVCYREVDTVAAIESSQAIVNSASDTTMVVPTLTTTVADQMCVAFMGVESGNSRNPLGAVWPANWNLVDDNGDGPPGSGSGSAAGGWAEQQPASAGTVTGGNLTYGGGNSHGAVVAVVLAPGAPPVIGIDVWPATSAFSASVTITGFGFGAVQGTGKVELWSDITGTTKVLQTVTSWSDTSIDLTFVQGALPNNENSFLVVTNDTGDESPTRVITFGLKPYTSIISDQAPDHWWTLSDTSDGQGGYADTGVFPSISNLTSVQDGVGGAIVATPICEDTPNSWDLNGGRRECANSDAINLQPAGDRLMGGWIRPQIIYPGLTCIYEEGGGVNNLCLLIGIGNRIVASYADTGDDNAQAFSDFALAPNRNYHVMFRFSHTDETKEFRLYIDGVKQAVTAGNPLISGDLDGHGGDISFGGPGGNLEVAGTDVLFVDTAGMNFAQWVTWRVSKPDSDILELFRRGALPDDTIATASSAAQQTALDALTKTRPNSALSIRVEPETGSGDATLDADGIVFPEEATIWVEWRGGGTLTWTNLNGSNLRADKVYTPLSGALNIINPATLTLTGLQNPSEVRVYETGTQTEIAGQENVTTGTFSTSVQTSAVDIVILSLGFQNQKLVNVATTADTSLPIQQLIDRQYENS